MRITDASDSCYLLVKNCIETRSVEFLLEPISKLASAGEIPTVGALGEAKTLEKADDCMDAGARAAQEPKPRYTPVNEHFESVLTQYRQAQQF